VNVRTCETPIVDDPAGLFYVDVLARLEECGVPFLVGGAHAYACYSHVERGTKDFDVFLKPDDVPRALAALNGHEGWRTELPFPHWLAKVHNEPYFMDLIFGSGNGVAVVDDEWFAHAPEHDVLGRRLRVCPPEEIIWSKAFIQERERFDGAEVLHLVWTIGPALDWQRLLGRFGDHWAVLLAHIVLFRFVYPDRRDHIPEWVVVELLRRFNAQREEPENRVCNGTLLSREHYLSDIRELGYRDGRLAPLGTMTAGDAEIWTDAIPRKDQ
jgi:hypothetical protein